ncbi:hypothetical protein BOX15_Mlig013401g2, partial [Macrostomum lignano]
RKSNGSAGAPEVQMGNSAFVQRIREREELRRESRREELLAFAESCQHLQAETVDNAKALLGRQLLKSAEGSVAEFANITRDPNRTRSMAAKPMTMNSGLHRLCWRSQSAGPAGREANRTAETREPPR